MARGKNVPPATRWQIVQDFRRGKKQSEIARDLNLNRQTVHRIIERERQGWLDLDRTEVRQND